MDSLFGVYQVCENGVSPKCHFNHFKHFSKEHDDQASESRYGTFRRSQHQGSRVFDVHLQPVFPLPSEFYENQDIVYQVVLKFPTSKFLMVSYGFSTSKWGFLQQIGDPMASWLWIQVFHRAGSSGFLKSRRGDVNMGQLW